jgi:hypothetical protein
MWSGPCPASTRTDLDLLQQAWAAYPQQQRQLPAMLEQGTTLPLLAPLPLEGEAAPGCVTNVVLSHPTSKLRLAPLGPGDALTDMTFAAGGVQLTRCGERRSQLAAIGIETSSPRAVIQALWVGSSAPLLPLERYLPARRRGPIDSTAAAPTPTESAGVKERVAYWTEGSRLRQGAERTQRVLWSEADGTGRVELPLGIGCHRLLVLGESTVDGEVALDIDADLLIAASDRVIDDHRELSAATLEVCLLQSSQSELAWRGAAGYGPVTLVMEHRSLPVGLPESWPEFPREQLAEALVALEEGGDLALGEPLLSALVPGGASLVPVDLPPDSCVLAAIASLSPGRDLLGLAIETPTQIREFLARRPGTAAVLALCEKDAQTALLQTSAGEVGGWVTGVFTVRRPNGTTP